MEFPDSEPVKAGELLTNVRDVTSDGSVIAWKRADGDAAQQAKMEELLFILGQAENFTLFFLREDPENAAEPFDLLALRTDRIPAELHPHCIDRMPDHLVRTSQNAIHIIVSTKSGLHRSLAFWQTVLRPLWDLVEEELASTNVDSLTPPPPSSSSSSSSYPPSKESRSVLITRDAQSIREFARDLASGATTRGPESTPPPSRPSRTIVLLSGDGGVVDLLNGGAADAQQEQLSLVLLPLGTANALFHSLHKPVSNMEHNLLPPSSSPLVLGLRTLFKGVRATLPVFRAVFSPGSHIVTYTPTVSGKKDGGDVGGSDLHGKDGGGGDALARRDVSVEALYGAVVASYGFHASIVFESDTPEYRVHGDKRFGMVAQHLLKESHAYLASVEARLSASSSSLSPSSSAGLGEKGGERDLLPIAGHEHAYVLVTPLSNLERNFTISPASKPLDGKLRLVHFGNVGGERTMEVMMKAYDGGKHVGLKWDDGQEVKYHDVEELRVTTMEEDERWRKVCIDGTIVELPRGGEFTIKKEKRSVFNVLVDKRVLPSDE